MKHIETEHAVIPKKSLFKNLDFIFLKMSNLKKTTPVEEPIDVLGIKHQLFEAHVNELKERAKINEHTEKIKNQQNQADKFLNANLYKLYFSMVNHGYQPTLIQNEHINNEIATILERMNKDYQQIDNLLQFVEHGYQINEKITYELLSNKHFQKLFFSTELFDPTINYLELFKPEISFSDFIQKNRQNVTKIRSKYGNDSDNDNDNDILYYEYNKNLQANKIIPIFKQIKEVIFTEEFSQYAASRFLDSLTSNKNYDSDDCSYYESEQYAHTQYPFIIKDLFNAAKFLEHLPHIILPKISLEQLIDFMTQFKNTSIDIDCMYDNVKSGYKQYFPHKDYDINKHLSHLCNHALETYYSTDIHCLLDHTKLVYSDAYLEEKAIKTTTILADTYKVNNLPQSSQELIKEIQFVYTQLQNHKQSFSEEQSFTINNIFDKRVPEVLQKYFSIDTDYRTNMKNLDGKNAQDLMNESLTNFKQKLTETLDSINELKLNDLNVSKRYSQKI